MRETTTETYQSSVIEESGSPEEAVPENRSVRDSLFSSLSGYARGSLATFGLDPDDNVAVVGFHAVRRITAKQRVVIEFVAQFKQTDRSTEDGSGGLPFRGGAR